MSDYDDLALLTGEEFADLAAERDDEFDRYDREALAGWSSREWGPE